MGVESFFRKREAIEGLTTNGVNLSGSQLGGIAGGRSSAELNQGHLVSLNVDVVIDNVKTTTGTGIAASRTFDFDMDTSVKLMMTEVCMLVDLLNIKPSHLMVNKTRIDDGTLATNKIESGTVVQLHVLQEEEDSGSSAASPKKIPKSKSLSKSMDNLLGNNSLFPSRLQPETVFMSFLMFDTKKQVLMTANGMLPSLPITATAEIVEEFGIDHKEFLWMRQKSCGWDIPYLEAINAGADESFVFSPDAVDKQRVMLNNMISRAAANASADLVRALKCRVGFLNAAKTFQHEFRLNKLGHMYHEPIVLSGARNTKVVLIIQFASSQLDQEVMKEHNLKWRSPRNLNQTFFNLQDNSIWALAMQYYQRQIQSLKAGVYLGVFRVKTTVNSIDLMVMRHDPDMVPIVRLKSGKAAMLSGAGRSTLGSIVEDNDAGQAGSTIDGLSPTKDREGMLSEAELTYLRYLAVLQKDPKAQPPTGLIIDKQMQALGASVQAALNQLAEQTGMGDLEFNSINPIIVRGDIMLLIFDCPADLRTQADQQKSTGVGFLRRLGFGKSNTDAGPEDKMNGNYFCYIPLTLFEVLHHNRYNGGNYTVYRQRVEKLQTDLVSVELAAAGATAQQQSLAAELSELRKQWNSNDSWALRVVGSIRERAMRSRTT